jgi:hypothetical protein
MKIFISISIWMLIMVGGLKVATPKERSKGLIAQENESVFVLKASKKFKGANVEVISSSGYLVTSQKLTKRKLVIDFKNVSVGTYRILVNKGSQHQEFKFIKK